MKILNVHSYGRLSKNVNEFEIVENDAAGDCLFHSLKQFLDENDQKFKESNINNTELRSRIVEYVLSKNQIGFKPNWERFKEGIMFNLQNHIPLFKNQKSSKTFNNAARKAYSDYMLLPGNCGTFTELDVAAEIFNFAGYIFQLNADGSYNCYDFGFSNMTEINKKKTVIHLLFTGNPDDGHFQFLKPISIITQITTGRYDSIPSVSHTDNQRSISITNKIPKEKDSSKISGELFCNLCPLEDRKPFASKRGLNIHKGKKHKSHSTIEEQSVNESLGSQTKNNERVPCPFSPLRSFKDKQRLQNHLEKKHADELLNLESLDEIKPSVIAEKLMFYRNNVPTLRRIPKGARYQAADKLTTIIENVIKTNSVYAWEKLLVFAYVSFNLKGDKNKSLTTKIKENIQKFDLKVSPEKKTTSTLGKRIQAKIDDFDIKGAIKVLSSNDKLAPFDDETYKKLQSKHPKASISSSTTDTPEEIQKIEVTEQQVKKKINSFQHGSGAGIDGFRPQFLKDVISKTAGEAGSRALTTITKFCNFIISGKVQKDIVPIFFGASLCALSKKDKGIRPIACGNALRRLSGKLACLHTHDDAHDYLNPHQVGVATKLGGESVVHGVRTYVNKNRKTNKIILKIDFQNAFNSIDREKMLSEIAKRFPRIFPLLSSSYDTPSLLFFGEREISSETGCQQGDPCGPLAFSVTIHPMVEEMNSEFNAWYLDDGTLADEPNQVYEDFKKLIKMAEDLGLKINADKCEIFFISGIENQDVIQKFDELSPGIRITKKDELEILGVPIFEEGFKTAFESKLNSLETLISRLPELNAHTAYFLLKNCLYIPKLTYMLRTSPAWKFNELTKKMDDCLKNSLQTIMNIQFNDTQWSQATLPVSKGGLGIRKVSDISLPAFLSSSFGVQSLVSLLLPFMDNDSVVHLQDEALDQWSTLNGGELPSNMIYQSNWDKINIERLANELSLETDSDKARFKALQEQESGAWLQAIPSNNIGTALNDQDFQVCIALRLGHNVYSPHKCICGSLVNESGVHGLACSKSKGRHQRHKALNKIIQKALASAHIGAKLEPIGLSRDDGKRPDGVTEIPWSNGQRLVWDATCVDTLAKSYLKKTMKEAGAAAEIACKSKHKDYTKIVTSNFKFVGVAFETMGPWCQETKDFIGKIGKMLIIESGDIRAKQFLYQRISLAIQQGNATSILGTLPQSSKLDEIYNL